MVKETPQPQLVAPNVREWKPCPECGGATLLYLCPHRFAGIWECQNPACGVSDSCEHERTDTETVTYYQPSQEQIDLGTDHDEEREITVCLDCKCEVET